MALIKCENCGNEYSNTATKCPHCGYQNLLVICPECETINLKNNLVCTKCGADFSKLEFRFAPKDMETDYYNKLVEKLNSDGLKLKELERLLSELEIFSDFENANDNILMCKKCISNLEQEEKNQIIFEECKLKAESASSTSDWQKICQKLETIINYKDAKTLYKKYISNYNESLYNECIESETQCKKTKDWESLKNKYEFLKDYKDSSDRAKNCREIITSKKSKKKKRIIKICSLIFGIVALAMLLYYLIIPGILYLSANNKFDNKEYAEAASLYKKAGNFFDSKDKSVLSTKADYYQNAEKNIKKSDYFEAAKLYAQSGDYKDAQQKLFDTAKVLIENKDYSEASKAFALYNGGDNYKKYADGMSALYASDYNKAIACFEEAKNTEDSTERLKEANYKEGQYQFNVKNYSSAKQFFKTADNYLNSKKMITACDLMVAETLYKEGSLNSAKAMFKKLPKKFSYKGISVANRLNTLAKYDVYVRMCGKWQSSKSEGITTEKSKSSGYWYNWTQDYSNLNEFIDVKCIINKSGKVTIKGSVEYSYYTNYSSISAGLESSSSTDTINKKVSSVPSGLKISSYTSITFSDGSWKLRYYKYSTNEDVYFNYIYESNYKYGKRVTKY